MVFWAATAAAAVVFIVALVSWRRGTRGGDALDYDDFVELGRAAWIDIRDEDHTRLTG
jgi:hypothetical protein